MMQISSSARALLTTKSGVRFFSQDTLRRTPLWALHKELGAKTTGFGGWDMPLQYKEGGMKEHLHCRAKAGLFDVSHMIPVKILGEQRVEFAERVLPADVANLPVGMGALSSLPNENGGLIDDLIVTNAGDHLYMVINAGHEDKDLPHMKKYVEHYPGARIEALEGRGILALQGPSSAAALEALCDVDMPKWQFMTGRNIKVAGIDCFVTRSGYTGEDGFELMCAGEDARALADKLLENDDVKLCGLGSRDSLRLESGLCLYGNDIDDDTSPVEAGLMWTIPKGRRTPDAFVGADKICEQLANKKSVLRKRVGFVNKGPPARQGDKVFDMDGNEIGALTSGVYGPTVKHNCSMGYVTKKFGKLGTALQVQVRGKMHPLVVTKMPFTPANFYRGE